MVDFIRDEIHVALNELCECPDAVVSGRITDYQHDPTMTDRGNGNGDAETDEQKAADERKRDAANQKRRDARRKG